MKGKIQLIKEGLGFCSPYQRFLLRCEFDEKSVRIYKKIRLNQDLYSKTEYQIFEKEIQLQDDELIIKKWIEICKMLPVEVPKRSEDIYKLNINLSFEFEDLKFQWENMVNDSCFITPSRVNATEEQKLEYQNLVREIIEFCAGSEDLLVPKCLWTEIW